MILTDPCLSDGIPFRYCVYAYYNQNICSQMFDHNNSLSLHGINIICCKLVNYVISSVVFIPIECSFKCSSFSHFGYFITSYILFCFVTINSTWVVVLLLFIVVKVCRNCNHLKMKFGLEIKYYSSFRCTLTIF